MTDYTDLQKAAEYAAQDTIEFADEAEEMRALQQFYEEVDPETVLALLDEHVEDQSVISVWRGRTERAEQERDALKAENAAALREATDLALAIWRRRFATESPDFQPFEKASSVIGQIDNMAAGLMCDQDRLKAEVETLRKDAARSRYWKQRCKSAEGHLWASDREEACEELKRLKERTSGGVTVAHAVAIVLSAIERSRFARLPKDQASMIWCACCDGYFSDSYGCGFMDANNGICQNCEAAMSKDTGQ